MKSLVAIVVASIGTAGALAGAFYTAKASADLRMNSIDTRVAVLEEKQTLQYTEVKDSLTRIEKKIDNLPLGLRSISLK